MRCENCVDGPYPQIWNERYKLCYRCIWRFAEGPPEGYPLTGEDCFSEKETEISKGTESKTEIRVVNQDKCFIKELSENAQMRVMRSVRF
jgi:hypothetical protein